MQFCNSGCFLCFVTFYSTFFVKTMPVKMFELPISPDIVNCELSCRYLQYLSEMKHQTFHTSIIMANKI